MIFHLFAYEDYYPGGGLNDYCGSFSTPEALLDYLIAQHDAAHFEIAQVVDGRLEETAIFDYSQERSTIKTMDGEVLAVRDIARARATK